MLQNDQIKVMMNVIVKLALSLLNIISHTRPIMTDMSSKQAMRLSKQDVLRLADSSDIVNRNW